MVASVVVVLVVVVVVVVKTGTSVVAVLAVSFISSDDDAVPLDSLVPLVSSWTLLAASAFIIKGSRSEPRAPVSSDFSSELLTLPPQSDISCNGDHGIYRWGDLLYHDSATYLYSSNHPVQVEAHLLPLPLVPLLLQLRRLRRVRLQRRRDRRPETADVRVGAQAALGELRQPALVLFQLAMLIKKTK